MAPLRLLTLSAFIGMTLSMPLFADDSPSQDTVKPAKEIKEAPAEEPKEEEPPPLTIGTPAPDLDIEHWIQNGNGKFKPVQKFSPGKVYIVEFWATWCGPCIASMPHIVEMQEHYAEQGVQVISISDEDIETVDKFLERKVRGEEDKEDGKTYRQLTSVYSLTTDPDRSNHRNYMRAAGRNGIPCAFIVGKTGVIEWIGHPMAMDNALASIVDGNWDREAFALEYKEEQEFNQKATVIVTLARRGKFEEAIKMATELRDQTKGESTRERLNSLIKGIHGLEVQQLILKNSEAAPAKLQELLQNETPEMINNFTWMIVQIKEQDRKISDEILATATALAEKALEKSPENAPLLDTLAHLMKINGNLDRAIELQTLAVKHADPRQKESIEAYLKTLQELKNPPTEKSADAAEDKKSE